ncbi:MAG: hypothetical protein IRZ00_19430 [Gemmatimonadetes bacterium]|nr:hypothetical protein [Gemmatimonadota bacterium]
MLPIGFVIVALLFFGGALVVAARDVVRSFSSAKRGNSASRLVALGEVLILLGACAVVLQGRPAGLVLAGPAAFVLLTGGTALLFVGMSLESRRG